MAQRTRKAETSNEPKRHTPDRQAQKRPAGPLGAYQEGKIESVGGGPSGRDEDDRSGQAGKAPAVSRTTDTRAAGDVFTSKEVADRDVDVPGRPARTRG
jgi:hypothetical protein